MKTRIMIFFAILLVTVALRAESHSSEITQSTGWNFGEVHYIDGHVTVPEGVTLTISHGVSVVFRQGGRLDIEGTLNVNGNTDFNTNFRSTAGENYTYIRFFSGANANINYANFDDGSSNKMLQFQQCTENITFNNCTFENSFTTSMLYFYQGTGNFNFYGCNINNSGTNAVHINQSQSTFTFNNTIIDNAGDYGIYIQSSPSSNVSVLSSSINNIDTAIYTNNDASLTVNNLTINNARSYPIQAYLSQYKNISGLTVNNASINKLKVLGSNCGTNPTVNNLGLNYYSENSLSLNQNSTLTFNAGVTFEMAEHRYFQISGNLNILGSSSNKVKLNAANASQKWVGIRFQTANVMANINNLEINNAGNTNEYGHVYANICIDDADSVYIANSKINGSLTSAIRLNNSDIALTIDDVEISDVSLHALEVTGLRNNLNVTNLKVNYCNNRPVSIPLYCLPGLHSVDLSNNTGNLNYVLINSGGSTNAITFKNIGVAYEIGESISSNNGHKITFEAGIDVLLQDHAGFNFNGNVEAIGTTLNPITFSKSATNANNWGSLRFNDNCTTAHLEYVELLGGGGYNQYNQMQPVISLDKADSVYIKNCTINDFEGYGINNYYASNGNKLVIDNLNISNGDSSALRFHNDDLETDISNLNVSSINDYPVRFCPSSLQGLNDISINNTNNKILIDGNSYTNHLEIKNFGYEYDVLCNIYTNNYNSLAINPGVVLNFAENKSIQSNGNFSALGTSQNPIIFTKKQGATNNWEGIILNNTCYEAVLTNCNFIDGGSRNTSNNSLNAMLYSANADSIYIQDCSFTNSLGRGIHIDSAEANTSVSILDCSFDNTYSNSILCDDNDVILTINNVDINNSGAYPISITPYQAKWLSNINLTNNSNNMVELDYYSTINSMSLPNLGYPYFVNTGVVVNGYQTLIIEEGTELQFNRDFELEIKGNLSALATANNPIVMKNRNTDEHWGGLYLNNCGNVNINYCQITNAGEVSQYGHRTYAINDHGATYVNVNNTTITNSEGSGIGVDEKSESDSLIVKNTTINTAVVDGFFINDNNFGILLDNVNINNCQRFPIDTYPILINNFSNLVMQNNNYQKIYVQESAITKNTTFKNFGIPYKFEGKQTVSGGKKLIVNAGVNLEFAPEKALIVNGGLQCLGTQTNPINVYCTEDSIGTWDGIKFINTNLNSELNYLNLTNAGRDESYNYNWDKRAMYVGGSNVTLNNCNINGSEYDLLFVDDGGVCQVNNSTLQNANRNGIVTERNSSTSLNNVSINNVQASGIVVDDNAVFNLNQTTITNCLNGIKMLNGTCNFGTNQNQWNKIYNNTCNVYMDTNNNLTAPYVYWGSTEQNVINDCFTHNQGGIVNYSPWFNASLTQLYSAEFAPTNFAISSLNTTTFRLSWNAEPSATSYNVYYSDDPNGNFATLLANTSNIYHDIPKSTYPNKGFFIVKAVR